MVSLGRIVSLGLFVAALGLGSASGQQSQQWQQEQTSDPAAKQAAAKDSRRAVQPVPAAEAPAIKPKPGKGQQESASRKKGDGVLVNIFRFFDKHNGSFNAIAAIAVAVFTFFLWRLTRQEVLALSEQGEELRRSIEATERLAQASERAAAVSERTFATRHRPRLMVEKVWVGWDFPRTLLGGIQSEWLVTNIGTASAWVLRSRAWLQTRPSGAEPQPENPHGFREQFWPVPPGHWFGEPASLSGPGIDLNDQMIAMVKAGEAEAYFFGAVDYRGIDGAEHEFRFLYRYRVADKSFIPHGHDFWRDI